MAAVEVLMKREDVVRELIEKYRKRITTYQDVIRELQAELSGVSGAAVTDLESQETPSGGNGLSIDVKEWQFMGKSQPDAARALLAAVGHPLTTEQIMEGIRKGGVEVGGGKYTFYTILSRSDDVVKFRPNTWGLTDWPGAPKKRTPQPHKKLGKRKKHEKAPAKAHRPDVKTETASE